MADPVPENAVNEEVETAVEASDVSTSLKEGTDTSQLQNEKKGTPDTLIISEKQQPEDDAGSPPDIAPPRLRSQPPKKGILKPPRPPVKPGIGGKLRDALGSIHPKFLDYAASGGNGQVSAAANGIADSPVGNLASGVIESAGMIGGAVGGAAAAVVGGWGGRLGRLVTGGNGSAPNSPSKPLQWKLPSTNPANQIQNNNQLLSGSDNNLNTAESQPSSPITQPPVAIKPLKKATFILPHLAITYSISSLNAPWSDKIETDRREVERMRTELVQQSLAQDYWGPERLVALYIMASKGREELARVGIKEALRVTSGTNRSLSLTSTPSSSPNPNVYLVEPALLKYSAEALADVLCIEWGLTKLVLQGGVIDHDDALKPVLHALLVSGTVRHLSLAGNRKIKSAGWRMIATFARRAQFLRYLDVSENLIDKRSADLLAEALSPALPSRSTDATKKVDELEEEQVDNLHRGFVLPRSASFAEGGDDDLSPAAIQTLRLDGCSLRPASLDTLSYSIRRSRVENLSLRRNRINASGAVAVALMMRDYPDTSALGPTGDTNTPGGEPLFSRLNLNADMNQQRDSGAIEMDPFSHDQQLSAGPAEKLGPLVTLDAKSNEIRGGVSYIAQVLKRNKTLKVLNLSDNKIDCVGLQSLAQAIRLNDCLETLDLSYNTCCGPNIDGVLSLVAALGPNSRLKRLYLNGTGLDTAGVMAIANALPFSHLLQLDISENPMIEVNGLSALCDAMQMNQLIRCLDVSLDHSKPEQAAISEKLTQACIRNSQAAIDARETAASEAVQNSIWAPIKNSLLIRQAKSYEASQTMAAVRKTVDTPAGLARNDIYTLEPAAVLRACEEVSEYLREFNSEYSSGPLNQTERQRAVGAVERAKALLERIEELIQETEDPIRLERLLGINDLVTALLTDTNKALWPFNVRKMAPVRTAPTRPTLTTTEPVLRNKRHMKVHSLELTSPNFSLTNSDDDDSDAEELSSSINPEVALANTSSPTFEDTLGESEAPLHSPLERVNKNWLEEEGEIFRKGVKLGVAEEVEEESGSDLKQKILDIDVARTPHKPLAQNEDQLGEEKDV